MNQFKLGTNFDLGLLDGIKTLNEKYENKIVEVYGSDRAHAFLAARPDFRLPEIEQNELIKYVSKANKINVAFNYTMNTIFPGSKDFLEQHLKEIENWIKFLENIGVYRITVANPLLLEIIRNVSKNIKLEISTIAHIDAVTQLKYYNLHYNVDKFCGNLIKNRSFKFLKSAGDWCKRNDCTYEVMVNEFCGVGGSDFATHCLYRDSCYLFHSTNKTKEDALKFNNFPMEYCMSSRKTDPCNWLRMRFVRPEDLKIYNQFGINHFKITGRTGSTEYLLKVAEGYMSETWNENLLALWKPLETIQSEESEVKFAHSENIPNSKLNGFISHWTNDLNFDCANEICGETCRYCHDFFDQNI